MAQTMAKQNNTVTTDELVVRAQSEAEALARLYDLYYPRVYRFCVVRTAHRQQAEDLTSEVFLQVARSMQRFRGSMEQDFRRWVFAIAANQANNLYRRTLRRARLLDRAAKQLHRADVSAAAEQLGLDWPVLHQAILRLKPRHQTMLALCFFADLDYESIGHIVHQRAGTVRVTLHRILNRLREQCAPEYVGGRDDQ